MNSRERTRSAGIVYIGCIIAGLTGAAVILCTLILGRGPDLRYSQGRSGGFDSGWYYMDDGRRVDVTEKAGRIDKADVTVYNRLPEYSGDGMYMSFQNMYQAIEVLVDGERIYQYGIEEKPVFGKMLGAVQCMVPLPRDGGGKEIQVRIINVYGQENIYFTGGIQLAPEETIIYNTFRNNIDVFFFVVIMVFIGTALMTVFFWFYVKKRGISYQPFFHMGIFAFLSGIWVLTDSRAAQFIFQNAVGACLLSHFSFMMFAVPLLNFIESICDRKSRAFTVLKYMFILNFLIQVLLYLTGISDFVRLLTVTHLLIGAAIVSMMVYSVREMKRNKSGYIKGIMGAQVILVVGALVSFWGFFNGDMLHYTKAFRTGLMIFVLVLMWMTARKTLDAEEERLKTDFYKSLAYMDMMTKTKNRTAFEREIEDIKGSGSRYRRIAVLLFDLNGLKTVNDTLGHLAGDKIITGAADCIKDVFGGLGDCYRIGGDEFTVIVKDKAVDEEKLRRCFAQAIRHYNEREEIKLSIAFGAAGQEFTGKEPRDMEILLKRADEDMYKKKRELKRKQ